MPHAPFRRLSPEQRRRALLISRLATLAQLAAFMPLERRMRRSGGPGIIGFELAGTAERAGRIVDTWGDDGRAAARRSLLQDYPFPPTYAVAQALTCEAAAARFGQGAARDAGAALAWGQFVAAGFDYVENTALLGVLAGRSGSLAALARRAALVKFALIGAGWAYVLASFACRSERVRRAT